MRKIGLFAFGLTTLVFAPAALHHLTAGPQQVAKLVAPEQHEFQLGDATIAISTDRALVEAGGKVRVKLAASAPTKHAVRVEVLVMESIGANGGRTEAPPNRVGRETITLQAAPGGGVAKELSFMLRGEVGSSIGGSDRYGKYTILAMEPKAADKLVALHDRANRNYKPERWDESFFTAYNAVRNGDDAASADEIDEETPRKLGGSARLEIATHDKDPDVDINAPSTIAVGRPFDVAVTVHNRKPDPAIGMRVELDTTSTYFMNSNVKDVELTLTSDAANSDHHVTLDIPAHSSKTVFFHITAAAPGVIPLYAHMFPEESAGYDMSGAGTLDAIEVLAPEGAPQVVGTRE